MNKQDRLIASCKNWSEFWERATNLPASEKGAAFERLTQLYLQTEPEYRTKLKHVWLLQEVPPAVSKRLDLPSLDEGIDLIARTRDGDYWAIQWNKHATRDSKRRAAMSERPMLESEHCA